MRKAPVLILVAALAIGVAAGAVSWKWSTAKLVPPEGLASTLLPDPRPLTSFRLSDQDGKPFGPEQFKGKWSFLFFGYTHCPDVCPTTLITLKGVADRLAKEPGGLKDTQFVFVSVDPKRDSLPHLKTYLSYFHPAFRGATGEKSQIDALVQQAGAVYMFEGDTSGDDYVVNHSAALYLVDPKGQLYARMLPPHDAGQIVDTLARVRHFYDQQ